MRILASYDRFIKRIVFADQTYVTASVTSRGPLFMVNLDSCLIGDLYLSRERVSKINCQQRPPKNTPRTKEIRLDQQKFNDILSLICWVQLNTITSNSLNPKNVRHSDEWNDL